jgi:DNA-binding SARP family transcriptional activator/TolB-like protein
VVTKELSLAPEQVRCDVWAFDEAVDQARPADALALYRGELLAGFHISAAPDFERWLDEERSRLRQRAGEAGWALAAARERDGDAVGAAEAARRAAALAPADETAVRRLMLLLERLGDKAAAVRAYEAFAWQLEGEYEVAPSAETQALMARIRADSGERQGAVLGNHTQPPPSAANGSLKPPARGVESTTGTRLSAVLDSEQVAQGPSADLELEPSADAVALIESGRNQKDLAVRAALALPSQPLSRTASDATVAEDSEVDDAASPERAVTQRRRLVLASLVTLGIAATIGAFVWRYRSPSDAPSSPGTIAILPFEYRGNPELSYLAEGMVELLSTKLDGAPGLRTVDPHALLTFVSRERDGNDLDRGRRAAEHFGADRFVLGNIVEAGERLDVSATVYDVERGSQGSIDASEARPAEIFEVADRLAQRLVSEVQDKPLQLARVADQATSSLPALKAYIEGEREFRNGRWSKAADAFQRAVQLDSTFALAHYRLSFMTRDLAVAREHLDRARRYSGKLGEHQRELIDATIAFARGDHKQADWLYRKVLTAHPDDLEAWLMLGGLILSRSPRNGYAWVDAREAFEHVLKLDPRNANALWQLAAYAARERRLAELDSLTERFLQLHPEPRDSGNVEGQRAIVRGDSAGLERFIADLRSRPDLPAQTGAGVVTWTTMDLAAGRRLWRLITEPNRSSGMRVLARATLAKLELTNGRWRAASAELDSAARLDPGTALEDRSYYALTYFLKLPRAELAALRDSLQRWNPATASRAVEGPAEMHRSVHRYLKLYLLGMLNARLGDHGAALRYASELERADSSSPEGAFAFDQAKVVRAEVARTRGRAEQALATLEQAGFWTAHSGLDDSGDSPFYAHIHEVFARAELLYDLGRMDEALRWYRALTYDILYEGPSHYRLAQIYQSRGDQRAAIQHYKEFVETWRDCDPMLRPKLQQAESELARLREAAGERQE